MRAVLYTIILLFLLAAIPWGFAEGSEGRLWGFPSWAVYSLTVSFLYACVVSVFVSRYWDNGDKGDDEDKGRSDQVSLAGKNESKD